MIAFSENDIDSTRYPTVNSGLHPGNSGYCADGSRTFAIDSETNEISDTSSSVSESSCRDPFKTAMEDVLSDDNEVSLEEFCPDTEQQHNISGEITLFQILPDDEGAPQSNVEGSREVYSQNDMTEFILGAQLEEEDVTSEDDLHINDPDYVDSSFELLTKHEVMFADKDTLNNSEYGNNGEKNLARSNVIYPGTDGSSMLTTVSNTELASTEVTHDIKTPHPDADAHLDADVHTDADEKICDTDDTDDGKWQVADDDVQPVVSSGVIVPVATGDVIVPSKPVDSQHKEVYFDQVVETLNSELFNTICNDKDDSHKKGTVDLLTGNHSMVSSTCLPDDVDFIKSSGVSNGALNYSGQNVVGSDENLDVNSISDVDKIDMECKMQEIEDQLDTLYQRLGTWKIMPTVSVIEKVSKIYIY